MVSMRLTTRQKSGPREPRGTVHPLESVPRDVLGRPPGTRCRRPDREGPQEGGRNPVRRQDVASELADLELLEGGLWTDTLAQCNRLTQLVPRDVEIEVARHIQEHFFGFGPKQSRNLLQSLGLTRYEIPIDSRLTDWLNEFGFPVRLTATALGDATTTVSSRMAFKLSASAAVYCHVSSMRRCSRREIRSLGPTTT